MWLAFGTIAASARRFAREQEAQATVLSTARVNESVRRFKQRAPTGTSGPKRPDVTAPRAFVASSRPSVSMPARAIESGERQAEVPAISRDAGGSWSGQIGRHEPEPTLYTTARPRFITSLQPSAGRTPSTLQPRTRSAPPRSSSVRSESVTPSPSTPSLRQRTRSRRAGSRHSRPGPRRQRPLAA